MTIINIKLNILDIISSNLQISSSDIFGLIRCHSLHSFIAPLYQDFQQDFSFFLFDSTSFTEKEIFHRCFHMNFTKFLVTLFHRTFASKRFDTVLEKDSKKFVKEFVLCDTAFSNRPMTNRAVFRIQSNICDRRFLRK